MNYDQIKIDLKTKIDFVINKGMRRYYIQSALALNTDDKEKIE